MYLFLQNVSVVLDRWNKIEYGICNVILKKYTYEARHQSYFNVLCQMTSVIIYFSSVKLNEIVVNSMKWLIDKQIVIYIVFHIFQFKKNSVKFVLHAWHFLTKKKEHLWFFFCRGGGVLYIDLNCLPLISEAIYYELSNVFERNQLHSFVN